MPTFEGSLQIAGDATTKMPAGIRVDGGRLIILAGPSDEIGNWSLRGLDITRRSGAFLLNVEGEQLLISVDNPEAFVRLVDLAEDQRPSKTPAERRSRRSRQKKERPPKKERAPKESRRRRKKPSEPIAEPDDRPAANPQPEAPAAVQKMLDPEPTQEPPAPVTTFETETRRAQRKADDRPARTPQEERPRRAHKPEGGVSLFAALPLSWKIGAAVVVVAVVLGIFAPSILTAILMLTGMVTLLLAVVVGTDSIAAARLPDAMTSTNTLVAGIILLVLSALMMVIA